MDPHEYVVMRQQEDTHWWYRTLRATVLRHLRRGLGEAAAAARILDAGCGTGGMLSALRAGLPRAELTGFDVDEQAVALTAARRVADHLVRASADALPFSEARFDAALSLDVLCHAGLDDHRAFADLVRVLRPGGLLIVNLPAFESLRGAHDVAVHTERRYTPRQLLALAAASDLRVERWTCWNALLSPLIWIWRRRSRRAAAEGSDVGPVPPLLNAGLSRLLQLEWGLADRVTLPFGSSVFAVLRRSGAR